MSSGYFLVHRKFMNDWKWQPKYRGVWLWILAEAKYGEHRGLQRGQCRFSVTWAQKEWGMSESAARKFLKRCENEKNDLGELDPCLLWERGRGGHKACGQECGEACGQECGQVGLITVLNYDKYQPNGAVACGQVDGQEDGQECGPSLYINKEENKKEKKKRNTRKSAGRPKTLEEVQEELAGICIADFERKWGPLGLDVIACFDNFCEFCLGKSPSNPVLNAGKYYKGHFSQAFTNKCKWAVERGWYRLKQAHRLSDREAREEIFEQRRQAREAHSQHTQG